MALSARMQRFVRRMHSCSYVTYKDYEQQYRAAAIIKKYWRRCISNPEYNVCKKRLLNEFYEMTS